METEIRKLKKRLLREERRRRKPKRRWRPLLLILVLLLAIAAGWGYYYRQGQDQRLEERYQEAVRLVDQGAIPEALERLRGLHRRHPGHPLAPTALYQEAEILDLFLERYPEALLAYLQLIRDYPGSALADRAEVQVAEIYKYRLRDYAKAIVAYQKLMEREGLEGDRIQYEVADAYFRLQNYEQARIEFESLLKNFPESPLQAEALFRTGVALSLEGDYNGAEEVFLRVSEEWPQSPLALEARFGLAAIYEEREELRRALELLEELEGDYPNPSVLEQKTRQVRERIAKKKKAI